MNKQKYERAGEIVAEIARLKDANLKDANEVDRQPHNSRRHVAGVPVELLAAQAETRIAVRNTRIAELEAAFDAL